MTDETDAAKAWVPDGYVMIPKEHWEQTAADAACWREHLRKMGPIGVPIGSLSRLIDNA